MLHQKKNRRFSSFSYISRIFKNKCNIIFYKTLQKLETLFKKLRQETTKSDTLRWVHPFPLKIVK